MGTDMGDSMARQFGKLTALAVQRAKQRGYLADGGGLIGLTATPFTDGMAEDWDGLVNITTVNKLLADGFLTPLKIKACVSPDMKGVRRKFTGEYDEEESGERGITIVGNVVDTWLFEYGVESLSDAQKKDKHAREPEEKVRKKHFCGDCGLQMAPLAESCPSCGWERPQRGDMKFVEGRPDRLRHHRAGRVQAAAGPAGRMSEEPAGGLERRVGLLHVPLPARRRGSPSLGLWRMGRHLSGQQAAAGAVRCALRP
jgi:hypothetical protein